LIVWTRDLPFLIPVFVLRYINSWHNFIFRSDFSTLFEFLIHQLALNFCDLISTKRPDLSRSLPLDALTDVLLLEFLFSQICELIDFHLKWCGVSKSVMCADLSIISCKDCEP
jgi:hypothetical protein